MGATGAVFAPASVYPLNGYLSRPKSKFREAEIIAQRIPIVMRQRLLQPAFRDWLLTADQGMIWLFGVLDLQRIQRLEDYQSADLLHHLSTDLHGKPVYLSNSDGLRYAILLSPPPALPRHLPFPGDRPGWLRLGQNTVGSHVSVSWSEMGHMLVVILDEFTAAVIASGGPKGPLATAAAKLSLGGRKFGVNLVFAAQDFAKAVIGSVRDQVSAAVCFRVRNAAIARTVGCADAIRIPESRPGLAITDRWGPLQAYYLEPVMYFDQGTW